MMDGCCVPNPWLGGSGTFHLLQEAQPTWSPDVSWLGIQSLPRPRSKVKSIFQVDKHDLQKRESICSKVLEVCSVILLWTLSRGLMQSAYLHRHFQHHGTCWIMTSRWWGCFCRTCSRAYSCSGPQMKLVAFR